MPFGRMGSSTCSHSAEQSELTRSESTPKTVGTWLTFMRPKRAIRPWPGTRNAVVGRSTIAATAVRNEPTERSAPATQRRAAGALGALADGVRAPPHPAAQAAQSAAAAIHSIPLLTLYRHFHPADVVVHDW